MLSETRPAKVGKWTEPALRVLRERYLAREGGEVVETPEEMCWRVALSIAAGEARYGRSEAAVREIAAAFYEMMIDGYFLPNSPTLMNAGKGNGLQYSACYVLPVGDSMEEIFDSVKAAAIIHKCLVGDTLVMSSGLTRLKDVPDGAAVMTDAGPFYVSARHDNGEQRVFEVRTNRGYGVAGTAEHRLLAVSSDGSYNWRKIGEIRNGDWLVMRPGPWIGGETKLPEFTFTQKPGGNCTSFRAREYRLPRELTPDLAELIGLYIGDGSNHRDGIRFTVGGGCPEVVRRIQELSVTLFGKRASVSKYPRENAFEVAILSTQVKQWFAFLGFTKTLSREARVPEIILRGPEAEACAFLRGLFTADGCVRRNGHITLTTSSRRLGEELQIMLLALGIPAQLRRDVSSTGYESYQLSVCTRGGFRRFREKIGFASEMKARRLAAVAERAIDDLLNRVTTPRELTRQRVARAIEKAGAVPPFFADLAAEEFFFVRVTDVRDAGVQRVYDLTVPEKHAYLANGFVSHNSGGGCISGDARVWTTFCGLEPIEVLANRATADGRTGERSGAGVAVDVSDLGISTVAMDPKTGDTGLRRVTHVWRFDVPAERQVLVETREGTQIQTSAWHPFMVVRPEGLVAVRADELAAGDIVLGPDRPDAYWPYASHQQAGRLVIDEAIGWLVGFTLGDGSFGYVPALRQYRLRWFSGEPDVLEKVRAVLAGRGINVSIQRDRRGLLSVATLTQRFVLDMLEACGLEKIGAKDERVRVPEVIAKSPLPAVRAFVAGLLDSDGYVAPDGSPSYATASREMAEDLAGLMSLLGYQPSLAVKPPRGKGKRTIYSVQLCPLPQVDGLRTDVAPYAASEHKLARLVSRSRTQTALRLRYRPWRDRLKGLGLVGSPRRGVGPCSAQLNRWSCNPYRRCRRDDLLAIADSVAPHDTDLAGLLQRVATRGLEIASVRQAPQPKAFYDLSVEEWNTYAAGTHGMAFVHNTGFAFSRLRPKDDIVASTGGRASGPVSFLRVFNSATEAVKQGGTRRGANMGILKVDHPDILEFIDCKLDGGITNFNISVAATDTFMDALAAGGEYDLINPHSGVVTGRLSAKEVFDRIVRAAWRTGDPGMVFIDRINASPANPTPEIGVVEATNPCVTGDTLVAVPDGWRRADTVQPGDLILTVKGPRPVEHVEINPGTPIFRVKFADGGSLRATAAHQFYVRRDGAELAPLRLDRCRIGDEVQTFHAGVSGAAKILSIETAGVATTYDLYEPETDTWITEGYVSRGCGEQPLLPNEACFAPGTRITTDRGLESVADLYERQQRGEPVLVATNLNGRGMHIVFRPAAVVKVGVRPTVRVTLTNGQQIRVTPDHRIMTEGGWKEAGALTRDDRVLIQTAMAGGLDITSADGDLQRLFGWFSGDGWFTKSVGLTFGPEDDVAFQRLVPVWREFTGSATRVQTQATMVRCIATERAEAIAAFGARGFSAAKGPAKRAPRFVFTAPKEEQIRYLQGLFCADGSKTHRKPQVTLTSASLELLRDVQLLLLNLGMRSNIKYYPHRPTGRAWGQVKVNGESYHRFLDLVGFPLSPKKQERCEKFPWQRTKHDRLAIPVASVDADTEVEVYDVSEPVTHSLIAEGMIVHNCNLGSLNVSKFARRGEGGEWTIDWDEVERVVRLGVRFLDDVIEMNPYPLPEIDATVKSNRRIGLGIMGWADLLFTMGIAYDSQEAIDLADRLMAFVKAKSHDQTAKLAEERGPFPNWSRSIYKNERPFRNSTVTTIAPTGTISMIAGCSSGIEPIFALAFEHRVKQPDGERVLTFVNETFEAIAKGQGFYSDALMQEIAKRGSLHGIPGVPEGAAQVFKTSHEIGFEWHVRHQAAFQRYTDNGVSKTINLPNAATEADVARAYTLAWELGCLGITVFRDGCKGEQVLNVGVGKKEPAPALPTTGPVVIRPRPHSLAGSTYRTETPIGTAFITVNQTPDGDPFEVFVQVGKGGSDTMAVAEALGRLISLSLRLPSPLSAQRRLEEVISQLSRIGGGQPTGFGPAKILSLPDALARTLAQHIGQVKPAPEVPVAGAEARKKIGDLCKECGQATFIYEEGCKKCLSCGFNEC